MPTRNPVLSDQAQFAINDPRFAPPAPTTPAPLTPAQIAQLTALNSPVIVGLPPATASFDRKYADATANTTGLPDEVFNALKSYELQRVKGGKPVLGAEQTAKAARAAATKSTPTPVKDKSLLNVPGNIVDDLKDIVKVVPRIPGALVDEGKRLLNIDDELARVDSLADITRLPGVDLLPGAYTAHNILTGTEGLREAATHPLFTALDLLPAAKGLAKGTEVAKLAESTAAAKIAAGEPAALNRINPIRTVLSKKILESPEGPVLVNRALGNAAELVGDSRVGQAWTTAFGNRTRQTVKPVALAENELQDLVTSTRPIPEHLTHYTPVIEAARTMQGILSETPVKKYGIEPARIAELTESMQLNPGALDNLPANESAWLADVKTHRAILDNWLESSEMLRRFDGELYLPADANSLLRTQQHWMAGTSRVIGRTDKLFAKYVDRGGMKIDDFAAALREHGWQEAHIAQIPEQIRPAFDAYQTWQTAQTPESLLAFKKEANKLASGRTVLGKSGKVGPLGDSGVTTLSEFQNVRKEIGKMQKLDARLSVDTAPRRFHPAISDKAAREYIAYKFAGDDTKIAEAVSMYERGLLSEIDGFSAEREILRDPTTGKRTGVVKGLADFWEDAAGTWRSMRDEGFDPTYVHRVSPGQAEAMAYPKVGLSDYTPANLKRGTLNMTPMVKDATISLQHEAVELLKDKITDDLIAQMSDRVAVPAADVHARFSRRAANQAGINPLENEAAIRGRMIDKVYEPYDAGSIFKGSEPIKMTGGPEFYIRKTDAKALRQIFQRKGYNIFSTLDPLTGIMRTSLLALSPRWHVYNVLGGAIMLQGASSWGVWKNAPEAWAATKKMFAGEDPGLPHDFVSTLGGMERDAAQYQVLAGRTYRRLLDQVMHGDEAGALQVAREPNALTTAGKNVIAKSYRLNQFVDDFYRTLAYMDGLDVAATKGLSESERIAMGMHQASRVLQDMTELTPFESHVLRQIFPFYNFYQHIMRYVVKYPVDHPARAAITSALARNELDMLGGLPHSFLEAFTWGKPNETGERAGMSLAGLNPFSSAGSLFTLAGWLGSTNPIAKTLIDQLGIDTQTGEPELYPQLTYDPMAGGLGIKTDNPITQLVANTLPQSQILLELLGASDEYKRLQRTNPKAAQRMLASQAGLPILLRTYNPAKTRITEELSRQEAQTKEKRELLKSGNLSALIDDPRFAEAAAKLAELQASGELAQYQPNVYRPSTAQLVTGAFGGQLGYESITPAEQDAYQQQAQAIARTPGNNRVTS